MAIAPPHDPVGTEPERRPVPVTKMPPPDAAEENVQQLARLRELRAVALDLQHVLTSVRKGEATLKTYAEYVKHAAGDLEFLVKKIVASDVRFDEDDDSIRHLQNIWLQMKFNPILDAPDRGEATTDESARDQLHHLNMLDEQCTQIVFQVGVLTIPNRLNKWLEKARPGYYVPFHAVFSDELPVYEDRVRVLRYLAWSPQIIRNGLVDVSNGLIYRYSGHPLRRLLSVVTACAAFLAATGLVAGSAVVAQAGWLTLSTDIPTLVGAWIAVLTGIVVHVAVATAKRFQNQAEFPPALPVGDLPRLVDAKIGQILLKVVLALIGLYGLAFADQATPLQAFLTGYSLDSVVDLFGASIERRAQSQASHLKQQLGMTA